MTVTSSQFSGISDTTTISDTLTALIPVQFCLDLVPYCPFQLPHSDPVS